MTDYIKSIKELLDEIDILVNLNSNDTKFKDFKIKVEKILKELARNRISDEYFDFKKKVFSETRFRTVREPFPTAKDLQAYKKGLEETKYLLSRVLNDDLKNLKKGSNYSEKIGFKK